MNYRVFRPFSSSILEELMTSIFDELQNNNPNVENLEPVIVRPTQQQIDNAIERNIFSNIQNPLNYFCPISQVDFSSNDNIIRLLPCNHLFFPNSILEWFRRHVKCPLCRIDIRDYDANLNPRISPQSEITDNSNNFQVEFVFQSPTRN